MKVYQVFHRYDVDGGFGDAVGRTDLLETFAGKEDAERFVEKYSDPHVYDVPYEELYCGDLYIKEIDIVPEGGAVKAVGFWWLKDKED